MKINSVSCDQFAGLRSVGPVEFNDGLNVVYGPNESGKSTLIGLIYSLLWRKSKVKSSKEDKAYKSQYFPAEVKEGPRGSTIDGVLVLEGDDGQYNISKTWSLTGSGKLKTPKKAVLDETADADAWSKCMETILKHSEGIYREVVFANQKTIDSVLQALMGGTLTSDLSSLASSAMLDMGGISSEKFLQAINDKIKALENSWDWITDGPKGGRGIDDKITKNVGLILAAYYQLEESRKDLKDLRAILEAVGTTEGEYNAALDEYNAASDALNEFDKYYQLLVSYTQTASLKKAADTELDRREKARKNWPKLAADLAKARELQAELSRADAMLLWGQVKAILDNDAEAEKAIGELQQIDAADVEQAAELAKKIEKLERKLKNFSALISFSLADGYELIVTSEVDGHRIDLSDGKIELSEAVKIEIPGVAEFHLSAADVNVEADTEALSGKKAELNAILEKYGVDSAAALADLQRTVSGSRDELERTRRGYAADLKKVLNGKETEEVKAAYEKANTVPTRAREEIVKDIKALTAKPIETFISLTEQSINNYVIDYESETANADKIAELRRKMRGYDDDLRAADRIPEEFRLISDPDSKKNELAEKKDAAEEKKKAAYEKWVDARAKMKAAEEAEDYMQPGELAETVRDNEATLARLREEYKAWVQIKSAAEEILNAGSGNPLQSFEDDFRKYLAFLSKDGVTLDSLSKKLEAGIYSGDNKMTYELLSEGTKDTIALAFRLAVMDFLFPDGGGFIVFDDPFTDMDADRRARACELLSEFAKKNQIIFVTCDESYVKTLGGNAIEFRKI